ncbi:hypothetical protein H5410_061231 [Solanum commersonii]|uniref:Uncharacterized protein n=1 Tax=Solanum commersonii TaxID=4109 RepID=A0A9J5W7J4_SOLCO|nr:hypothetical protein H5410_061231 [Solanum commersonii]
MISLYLADVTIIVVSNLKQALVTLGSFKISTISMSSVLINPQFQKSTDLAKNKGFMVTPSTKVFLYKFKETIVDILNKDKPWYLSCKNYSKKVKVIEHIVSCNNCNNENVEYEMRYCFRLEVCSGEQSARFILFEAAKYILGSIVQHYIESTSIKI